MYCTEFPKHWIHVWHVLIKWNNLYKRSMERLRTLRLSCVRAEFVCKGMNMWLAAVELTWAFSWTLLSFLLWLGSLLQLLLSKLQRSQKPSPGHRLPLSTNRTSAERTLLLKTTIFFIYLSAVGSKDAAVLCWSTRSVVLRLRCIFLVLACS